MKWAEHWFKIEEYRAKKKFERRVFIATDDSTVFSEARKTLALFFMFFSLYVLGEVKHVACAGFAFLFFYSMVPRKGT